MINVFIYLLQFTMSPPVSLLMVIAASCIVSVVTTLRIDNVNGNFSLNA